MLTKAGAKLLDFGLAKLRTANGPISMSGVTQVATRAPETARGTILGTVQYMAPEQVEGKDADARSDIWAFGAVLYEMVGGTRPFQGDTPASVIGAILKTGGNQSRTSGGSFRNSSRAIRRRCRKALQCDEASRPSPCPP